MERRGGQPTFLSLSVSLSLSSTLPDVAGAESTKINWVYRVTSQSTSLVAQMVKRLPAMRETWVRSLDQGRCPGEGNGNPLQYSCLENSMDRRAL